MFAKVRKLLAAAGASAALLVASPASAWDLYIFYDANGAQIGYQIVNGYVCEYHVIGVVAYYEVYSYPGNYC